MQKVSFTEFEYLTSKDLKLNVPKIQLEELELKFGVYEEIRKKNKNDIMLKKGEEYECKMNSSIMGTVFLKHSDEWYVVDEFLLI